MMFRRVFKSRFIYSSEEFIVRVNISDKQSSFSSMDPEDLRSKHGLLLWIRRGTGFQYVYVAQLKILQARNQFIRTSLFLIYLLNFKFSLPLSFNFYIRFNKQSAKKPNEEFIENSRQLYYFGGVCWHISTWRSCIELACVGN